MEKLYYDAFISYRHTQLDSYIAKKLHGMLEHYRIPKKIQEKSGKKRITRVFRDQEELPLSSDLSSNIKTALEHSEFLIVICSPEAMESRWVKTEINTFLETHDKDHVLTILVRGEPEEAFPEVLCYREQTVTEDGEERIIRVPIEPLAADVRADSKEAAGKKLKKEILRILAPMLSCSFDDLRQRQKEYKTKWIIGMLSAVLGLAVAFGFYAAKQAAAIDARYQEARRNQARYLCNISNQLLKSGDREGALLTALALQTEDGKEALVPEQMYALNNALYSYQNHNSIYLSVDRTLKMENPVKELYPKYVCDFSPEGEYFFALDKLGKAYFFDSTDGECLYSVMAEEFPDLIGERFLNGVPVSETETVLVTGQSIVTMDIKDKEISSCVRVKDSMEGTALYQGRIKIRGNRLLCHDGGTLFVYDYINGERLLSLNSTSFGSEEPVLSGSVVDYAFSPSGEKIAVVMEPKYLDEEPKYGMMIFDLLSGAMNYFEVEAFDKKNKISFIDEEYLASVWIPPVENEYALESYRPYCYGLYNISTGDMLWSGEGKSVFADYTDLQLSVEWMKNTNDPDSAPEPMMITHIGNELKIHHAMSGEELSHVEGTGKIIGVERIDNTRFFVAMEDGKVDVTYTAKQGNLDYTTDCGMIIAGFKYSPEKNIAAVISEEKMNVVLYRTADDPYIKEIAYNVSSIQYTQTKDGKSFRHALLYSLDESKKEEMLFWDINTDEYLGSIQAEMESQEMEVWSVISEDELYALYSLSGYDYRSEPQKLLLKNITDDQIVYKLTLENIPEHRGDYYEGRYDDEYQVVCSSETSQAAVYLENYFEIIDFKTGEILMPFREIEMCGDGKSLAFCKVTASEDGKYFIFAGKITDWDYNQTWCFLKLWDIENGRFQMWGEEEACYYQIPTEQADLFFEDNLLIGEKTLQAAVYMEGTELMMIDLLSGEVTQKIPFSGKNHLELAFFDEERYLLLYGDEQQLLMWSLEEEKMVMKDSEKLSYVSGIYTDESDRYFGIAGSSHMSSHMFHIYSVDEHHRFYHFADIANGFASFQSEEAFNFGHHDFSYYTKFYDYETLKHRAEEFLKGKSLSEEEQRMYYISD